MDAGIIKLTSIDEIQIWKSLEEKSVNLKIKLTELSEQLNQIAIQVNEDNEDQ